VSAQTLLNDDFVAIVANGHQEWAKAGQWLVEFKSPQSKSIGKLNSSLSLLESTLSPRFTQNLGDGQTFLLHSDRAATLTDIKASLAEVSDIRSIEPDYAIYQSAVMPNDPLLGGQWALHQANDHDIDAPEAWELSTGSPSVVIAVPDSGIDYNHVDLSTNIWKNYAEIAGNGIDDDADGYIDDVRGWDWVNNDNDPMDDNSHGTIVAGEIGARGNNSLGVSGVAWQVKMMPLKFIANTGLGASSGALSGINYAIKQKQAGVNLKAVNASWVNNSYSLIFQDTILNLKTNGILFVAGAGNGGGDYVGDDNDIMPTFPASYAVDNVISVAATDQNDVLASFSNYGAVSVALAAPGVGISSTSPGNGYTGSTGTSDSAPLVTGVVALAAAAVPNATYLQVRAALVAGADLIPSLTGMVQANGRLNARKTLELLLPLSGGDGLSATYFNNFDFTGTSVGRVDSNVGFDWSSNAPLSGIDRNTYSARWTGAVSPASTETYTFYTRADDGVRLWVNGQQLINRWTDRPLACDVTQDGVINTDDFNVISGNFGRGNATVQTGDLNGDTIVNSLDVMLLFANWGNAVTPQEDSATIALTAGVKYSIQLDYYQNVGRGVARLSWASPSVPKQIIPQNSLFSIMPVGTSPIFPSMSGIRGNLEVLG